MKQASPMARPARRTALWLAALALTAGQAWSQDMDARARKIVNGVCFLCHGADGLSTSEIFPKLAGQNADYIAKQLENFKSGKRQSSAMADMSAKLTPQEMQALGRYYAALPNPREAAKDAALAAVGQYIFHSGNKYSGVPACASCHGKEGAGSATLPRLAGQFSGYIETQLKLFHQRQRTNDNAVMHAVVEKMTPLEMAAVAEYLGGQ